MCACVDVNNHELIQQHTEQLAFFWTRFLCNADAIVEAHIGRAWAVVCSLFADNQVFVFFIYEWSIISLNFVSLQQNQVL